MSNNICPHCSKPMKQLWSSFYCDCKKEVISGKFSSAKEAYVYAAKHGSSDNTREIVCKDTYWAFCYALHVDNCKHPDTEKAVKGTDYEEYYKKI